MTARTRTPRKPALPDLTYTIPQLAVVLHVSRATAYKLVGSGAIATLPGIGRRLVVSRHAVDRYLAGEQATS